MLEEWDVGGEGWCGGGGGGGGGRREWSTGRVLNRATGTGRGQGRARGSGGTKAKLNR